MTNLKYCKEKAIEIEQGITDIINNSPVTPIPEFLRELQVSLSDFTGTKLNKRSLLPFVGNILNSLFGVATDANIEREKERLNTIERWASQYGNVINQLVDETNLHANVLNNLSHTINLVEENLERGIDKITTELFLNELTLQAMSILEQLKSLMEGLRLAHQGTVSINLLSPKELEEVVQYAIYTFKFHPLSVDTYSYYSLMTVKVVYDQVYIIMPFNSDQDLMLSKITPFPMQIEGESIILDRSTKLILEKENSNLISIWEEGNLENCIFVADTYICNNQKFFLQPVVKDKCIQYLLNNGDDNCAYKFYEDEFYVEFLNELYIYTKNREQAVVKCQENPEERIEIHNLHTFSMGCQVQVVNHFYYTPHVFQSVQLNETRRAINMPVNITHFKLPRANVDKLKMLNRFQSNILFMYRENVMPWVTITMIPLIIVICVTATLLIRSIIFRKIEAMNTLLKASLQK